MAQNENCTDETLLWTTLRIQGNLILTSLNDTAFVNLIQTMVVLLSVSKTYKRQHNWKRGRATTIQGPIIFKATNEANCVLTRVHALHLGRAGLSGHYFSVLCFGYKPEQFRFLSSSLV